MTCKNSGFKKGGYVNDLCLKGCWKDRVIIYIYICFKFFEYSSDMTNCCLPGQGPASPVNARQAETEAMYARDWTAAPAAIENWKKLRRVSLSKKSRRKWFV